jgi:hypothetical protein
MTNIKDEDEKPNPIASALMKLWTSLMIFSTAVLSFYVFVLKDNSALPFVALGIAGLCIPPIVSMIRTLNRNHERKIKYKQLMHTLELEKLKQARIRERERLAQEELYGEKEAAENEAAKEALKNVNMAAYKPN